MAAGAAAVTGALLKGEPGHLGALVLRARAYTQLADLDLAKRHLGEVRRCVLLGRVLGLELMPNPCPTKTLVHPCTWTWPSAAWARRGAALLHVLCIC